MIERLLLEADLEDQLPKLEVIVSKEVSKDAKGILNICNPLKSIKYRCIGR